MKWLGSIIVIFWSFYLINQTSVLGEDTSINDGTVLNKDWSYCFEFTWLGPDYDNMTRYNGTCTDYLDEHRAVNVPCSPPLVITYNGTPPNIDWLWQNKRESVLCRKSEQKVCGRYTYRFNGMIENVTYMCTKVQAIGEGAVTSGTYTQMVDGYEVELYVCNSGPGIYWPCNSTGQITINLFLLFISLFLLLNYYLQ